MAADGRGDRQARAVTVQGETWTYPQITEETVYLDNAGSAVPCQELLSAAHKHLATNLLINSHTTAAISDAPKVSPSLDTQLRTAILTLLNVSAASHTVVITASATAALQIVAECYAPGDATGSGMFMPVTWNHTSVLGMRGPLAQRGLTFQPVAPDQLEYLEATTTALADEASSPASLFALPAQCNFSGRLFDLDLLQAAREGRLTHAPGTRFHTLLDASALLATGTLDLAACCADFTVFSCYKLFGYPSGLGALVVRNESMSVLANPAYFGGGGIAVYDSRVPLQRPHKTTDPRRFEHGSLPHTALAGALGPVVTFNMDWADGSPVSVTAAAQECRAAGIIMRSGCMCNAGACHDVAGNDPAMVQSLIDAGYRCGSHDDVVLIRLMAVLVLRMGVASGHCGPALASTPTKTMSSVSWRIWTTITCGVVVIKRLFPMRRPRLLKCAWRSC
ncbi:uncharacterized protein MONBRDRAFT_26864 [Monosiga brevicollis MX1]|uniref:Aminotransferase class V domain-containing protein n=1 Tax=Monosiga brevicollis TaxID=81824 RepID=A9V3R6_MONBE|nr:uncharacterized protein MONBRDRAFT_26864 [Monosiga brevicollis MX1]EDQ87857.1 predicted protein [Monosiga brevicollis MX1]|eukprot:XP_001747390.1 hypothetical protein [Monosiga brevicollis MX1]